jgi:hypothetical protein
MEIARRHRGPSASSLFFLAVGLAPFRTRVPGAGSANIRHVALAPREEVLGTDAIAPAKAACRIGQKPWRLPGSNIAMHGCCRMTPKTFVVAVFVALLASPALARVSPAVAASSDYRAIVPPDWTLLPPDNKWHGRRFVSPSGNAWLALYAKPVEGESVQTHMDEVRSAAGERITYEREGQSWIVVSGFKGDRIFYRKAILACGARRWHHLAFEYPAAEKRAFDRFVTRASYALKSYERVGCGPYPKE